VHLTSYDLLMPVLAFKTLGVDALSCAGMEAAAMAAA
jgi:hypothetical protein